MRLADALKIHNAINGLYVDPLFRKDFTVNVRVVKEYEVKIKAPDRDTAIHVAGGLVQAGLAGDYNFRREFNVKEDPKNKEIERRQRLFSRGINEINDFSRDMIERQLHPRLTPQRNIDSLTVDFNEITEHNVISQEEVEALLNAARECGGITVSGDDESTEQDNNLTDNILQNLM